MKTTRYLDVCTIDGKVIFSFCLTERDGNEPVIKNPVQEEHSSNGNVKKNGDGSQEEKMTDAQQRKLFRILAENGFDSEKAHQELLKRFKVNNLKDIWKSDASRMIDRMLKEGGK